MAIPSDEYSPLNDFITTANVAVNSYSDAALTGESPVFVSKIDSSPNNENISLLEDGVSVFLNQNRAESIRPNTRNIISMTPEATILIKKKAFSTLAFNNDLKWMDKSEKVLLRATKVLFAYKVAQLRAYESLTKLDEFFEKTNQINLAFYADFLYQMQFLSVPKESMDNELDLLKSDFIARYGSPNDWSSDTRVSYQAELDCLMEGKCSGVDPSHALELVLSATRKSMANVDFANINEYVINDLMSLIKRNAFAQDHYLTTWIVDPSDPNNWEIGPGTGVIEVTTFSSFTTTCQSRSGSPSSASFSLEDPYRLTIVLDDDVELAIQEALMGNVGLISSMLDGTQSIAPIDGSLAVSSAFELLGLGDLDGTIDVDYIRDRLRVFYLGKCFINPADGVHFYIRGNRRTQDFSTDGTTFDSETPIIQEEYAIDDTVLEAERRLYTNENIDLETYKAVRDTSSLSMAHVFGGFVTDVTSQYRNGKHNLTISCKDNLEWLKWSRVMTTPALQDPQGILEDPLTPFEITKNELGQLEYDGAPELLYENKYLLKTGLLSFDSGILNGQVANENNLYQGQYNAGGSLYGSKVVQHPSGLIYRWKTGVITATAGLTSTDPNYGEYISAKQHTREYGLNVAKDVFNNLDVANILSIMIVGQPYNVETFMKQSFEVGNISSQSSSGNINPLDPLYAVLNAIRTQNTRFGNFRPYRMITMSNQTWQQSTNDQVKRTMVNSNIERLQKRKANLLVKINQIARSFGSVSPSGSPLVHSLQREISSIESGIRLQLSAVKSAGSIDGYDLLSATFNLFGTNRVLPFSGDFDADAQVTRAMSIVGAQRRIEDVRLNRDQNLFIVSDQYDNNVDIKPYIFALNDSGWSLFKGKYEDSYTTCKRAASLLDLEFFCNANGHIELRPPLWNRTPLSVLKKLVEIKKSEGKNVIPDFLESLFDTRISSIKKDIHTMNVQIALLALMLGFYPDKTLIPGVPHKGSDALEFFGIKVTGGKSDLRIEGLNEKKSSLIDWGSDTSDTSENGALLGGSLNLKWSDSSEGDILSGDTETILGEFDPITQEAFASGVVDRSFPSAPPATASSALSSGTRTPAVVPGSAGEARTIATISIVNKIRDDYKRTYGADPMYSISRNSEITAEHFAFKPKDDEDGKFRLDSGKTFSLIKKLEVAVSKRDSSVTTLQRNLDKQEELEEIGRILETGNEDEFEDVQGDFEDSSKVDIQRIVKQDDGFVWVETKKPVDKLKDGDYILIEGVSGTNSDIVNGTHYAKFVSGNSTYSAFALTLTSGSSILGPAGFSDSRSIRTIEGINDSNATITRSGSKIQGRAVGVIKGLYDVTSSFIDIFTGDATKGSLFDHLIEDDTRNMLGPGSGRRFVIRNESIISATLRESPPSFTRINVTGDAPIIGDAFQSSFQGVAFWAGGTDFDLWRQYGYIERSERLPFASDAELQCRPYAVLKLMTQRAAINKGSITVAGNEYYQPGDTIYIPYKGMLYYVTSVSHSFSIGSSFTTSLTLEFGHPPGEYLPSPLDVIGQQYVGNPLYENFLVYRNEDGDDKYRPLQPDSAILFPSEYEITESNINDLLDYKNNMARFYNMMIDLSNIIAGDRYVLIRGFHQTSADKNNAENRVNIIKSMLTNPVMLSQSETSAAGATSLGDDMLDFATSLGGLAANNSTKETQTMKLPNGLYAEAIDESSIIIQIVDLSGDEVTSEIGSSPGCMNKELFSKYQLDKKIGTDSSSAQPTASIGGVRSPETASEDEERHSAIFPSSGPKQAAWLEFRDSVLWVTTLLLAGLWKWE